MSHDGSWHQRLLRSRRASWRRWLWRLVRLFLTEIPTLVEKHIYHSTIGELDGVDAQNRVIASLGAMRKVDDLFARRIDTAFSQSKARKVQVEPRMLREKTCSMICSVETDSSLGANTVAGDRLTGRENRKRYDEHAVSHFCRTVLFGCTQCSHIGFLVE
jgi:hypothetical protein